MTEAPAHSMISNDDEQQFLDQQKTRFDDIISRLMVENSCSRGKAIRIAKARSRKVIKAYNKSVQRNANQPKIEM